jgi:hypothetical protein
VRYAPRPVGHLSGLQIELLVSDEEGDLSVQDDPDPFLVLVNVQWRRVAGRVGEFQDGEGAAGCLGGYEYAGLSTEEPEGLRVAGDGGHDFPFRKWRSRPVVCAGCSS